MAGSTQRDQHMQERKQMTESAVGAAGRLRDALCGWLAAMLVLQPALAWAGPQDGDVLAGDVEIVQVDDHTWQITASDGSVIRWNGGMDLLPHELLEFIQPHEMAAVLNQIMTAAPTHIDGTLLANGQVYIVNPAGVIFGPGAVVDVARLVAAGGDLSVDDFLAGSDHFTNVTGDVVNSGQIEAAMVALVGRHVLNHGLISAEDGLITLVAGHDVLIGRPGHDGYVKISVDELTEGAGVENTGTLDAGEGQVTLAAGDFYSLAVRHTGTTRARSIALEGGEGGLVEVGGTLDASDRSEGGSGGVIHVLGDKIAVRGAEIDASGDVGGGEILIGGDVQGGGDVPTASRTYVDDETVIRADAESDGDGGKIVVWADEVTAFEGEISATGGATGGDGGFAEVSAANLVFRGGADLSAENGETGTLLLDPEEIVIQGGATNSPGPGTDDDLPSILFDDPPDMATVTEDGLEALNADVLLEATTGVRTAGDFSDDTLTVAADNDLTLRTRNSTAAGDDADVATPQIDLTSSDEGAALLIQMQGDGNLEIVSGYGDGSNNGDIDAPVTLGQVATESGSVAVRSNADINVNGAIRTGDVDVAESGGDDVAESGSISLDAAGAILGNAAGTLRTGSATADGTTGTDSATSGGITLVSGGDTEMTAADNALQVGDATVTNGDAGDSASVGDMELTAQRIAGGIIPTFGALDVAFGSADAGAGTSNPGLLRASSTGTGGAGGISARTGEDLSLGTLSTGASPDTVVVSAGPGATLSVAEASSLDGDSLTLQADEIEVDAAIGDALGIRLLGATPGQEIELGSGDAAKLNLTQDELGNLTATTLRIGSVTAGAIEVTEAVDVSANVDNLALQSGGSVTDTGAGAISANGLAVESAGATLDGANNVETLAAAMTGDGNGFEFNETDGFTVGTVAAGPDLTGIRTADASSDSGDIVLESAGTLLIDAPLTTGSDTVAATAGPDAAETGSIFVTSTGGAILGNADGVLSTGDAQVDGAGPGPDTAGSGSVVLSAAQQVELQADDAVQLGDATVLNPDAGDLATVGNFDVLMADRVTGGGSDPLEVVFGTATGGGSNPGTFAASTDGGAGEDGAVRVRATAGNLVLGDGAIAAGDGLVDLSAVAGSIDALNATNAEEITTTGDVTLDAIGIGSTSDQEIDIGDGVDGDDSTLTLVARGTGDVNVEVLSNAFDEFDVTSDGAGAQNIDVDLEGVTDTLNLTNAGGTLDVIQAFTQSDDGNGGDTVRITATTSDIAVGTVDTGTALAALDAQAGAINDASADAATDITAGSVDLDAATGIGAGEALELVTSSVTADTSNGDVDLDNAASAATTVGLSTGSGDIRYDQTGNQAITNLTAVTGGGSVEVTNTGGSDADVGVDDVSATVAATILSDGAIEESGDDAAADVSGSVIDLDAQEGIGSAATLEIAGSTLRADTVDGDVDLAQDGNQALTVASATAAGAVTLTNSGGTDADIAVDRVAAGTTATLVAGGEITENPDPEVDIEADAIVLDAVEGIGAADSIEVAAGSSVSAETDGGDIRLGNAATGSITGNFQTSSGTIVYAQTGNQALTELVAVSDDGAVEVSNTGGTDADVTVANVSGTAAASIVSSGAIEEAGDDAAADVSGDVIDLTAEEGIGSAATLEIAGSTLTADTTDGDVDLAQDANQALTLASATAGGAVTIANTGGTDADIAVGSVVAGTVATLNSSGAITENNPDPETDIAANSVDLDAVEGIGTAAEALEIAASSIQADNSGSGDVNLENDASSTGAVLLETLKTVTGNAFFRQTGGEPLGVVDADVTNGSIVIENEGGATAGIVLDRVAAANGDVLIRSEAGIFERNDPAPDPEADIVAMRLALITDGTAVGFDGEEIETQVSELAADVGSLDVVNDGDLEIGTLAADGFEGLDADLTGVEASDGDAEIEVMSRLFVNAPVNAPMGSVILDAAGNNTGTLADDLPAILFGPDVDQITAGTDIRLNTKDSVMPAEVPTVATIAKVGVGDAPATPLTFEAGNEIQIGQASTSGALGSGQKFTSTGDVTFDASQTTTGDVSARNLTFTGGVRVVRRAGSTLLESDGGTVLDSGVDLVADTISIGGPSSVIGDQGAVTLATESGAPVANAPNGSFFLNSRDPAAPLANEDFIGQQGDADGAVLDLVGTGAIPVDPTQLPDPVPEEVTLRVGALGGLNQLAVSSRPLWAAEVVSALECALFEDEDPELVPPECEEFLRQASTDPRLQTQEAMAALEERRRLDDDFQRMQEALQEAARGYLDAVPESAVSGEGFRRYVAERSEHLEALGYLSRLEAFFQNVDAMGGEAAAQELDDWRLLFLEDLAPVGLSPEELDDAIRAGDGSDAPRRAAGQRYAAD